MENLNDAEFGSDKDSEEAPILIAQRYLNIFRQIHIFNKAKRDQFDDELLALPNNVFEYFKRMPGGRLLVEHVEEVKTNRGIAFVKSNKDDFTNGADTNSAQSPQQGGAVVPQFTGGNLVLDNSFAETFSKSMAEAFKHLPTTPISGESNVSLNLGNTFDVIAEEIRSSRQSLLDVLKETRSITDSVIASQVSISRVLENILSARSRDENDVANLNNRIIASQASITKLLESLYLSKSNNNVATSQYNIDIEQRLQDFKQEINESINNSLSRIQDMISSNKVIEQQSTIAQVNIQQDEIDERRRKKKKKKKNIQDRLDSVNSIVGTMSSAVQNYFKNSENEDNYEESSNIDTTIHNDVFKHNDNFDNVNLNEPPLDILEDITNDLSSISFDEDMESKESTSNVDDFQSEPLNNFDEPLIDNINNETSNSVDSEEIIDDLDFSLPEQNSDMSYNKEEYDEEESIEGVSIDIVDDGLSFTLPESTENQSDKDDDMSFTLPESTETQYDDLDLTLFEPTVNNNDNIEDLVTDNIISDNNEASLDLDSNVIEDIKVSNTVSENNKPIFENRFSNIFDEDIISNDDVIENNKVENSNEFNINDIQVDEISLDNFIDNTIEQTTNEDNIVSDNTSDLLNHFEEDNNEDISLDNLSSVDSIEEINIKPDSNLDDVDIAIDSDINDSPSPEKVSQSRYSAELDKIRQALTSDDISLSSIDQPIELDDYNDDENLAIGDDLASSHQEDKADEDWEYEYVEEDNNHSTDNLNTVSQQPENSNEEDWEWEYVDENGNPAESDSDDWEWEYVEEDDESDNNK